MHGVVGLAVAAAVLAGGSLHAQTAPQVYRLSPEEVLRLQDSTSRSRSAFDAADSPRPRDGRIHGEIGVGIGTNGYRSLSGIAEVPLGDSASALLAFETGQFSYPRRTVRGWGAPIPVR